MAHSYHQLLYHIVFGVKHRRSVLKPPLRFELFRYMAGIIIQHDGQPHIVNGVEDHVHLLVSLGTRFAIADVVRDLKASSSKHLNALNVLPDHFEWQGGYSIFSVSHSLADKVHQYIVKQEAHHAKLSFREEYLQLLQKHGLIYDVRFVMESEFLG